MYKLAAQTSQVANQFQKKPNATLCVFIALRFEFAETPIIDGLHNVVVAGLGERGLRIIYVFCI